MALLCGESRWWQRARDIALYHLEYTQPDHVTAQPWAVLVFAAWPDTASFADQQLHDTQVYWRQGAGGTGGGDLVPALLLSDAACAISGSCDMLIDAGQT
jgi:hypothetical protein